MDIQSIKASGDICQFINHTLKFMTSEQIEYIKDNVVDYIDSYKSYEDTDVFADDDEDDDEFLTRDFNTGKLTPKELVEVYGGTIERLPANEAYGDTHLTDEAPEYYKAPLIVTIPTEAIGTLDF